MKDLVYQIRKLCREQRDGSFETRRKRETVLMMAANQLVGELGYQHMKVTSLKPKHVDALVRHWQSQKLAAGTIKVRMSQIRWWARKINKNNVVARDNDHYDIEKRVNVTETSKAVTITDQQIENLNDEYVQASVKLARAFGLRKEEAIKIIPTMADEENRLYLKASWCKGGRERFVPICNDEQRQALDNAKQVAKGGSLIPGNLRYIQQRKHYEYVTLKNGITRMHGLRHQYAQTLYRELTGWECSHRGGPKRMELNVEKKEIDIQARLKISTVLGHNRIEVVAVYLGA